MVKERIDLKKLSMDELAGMVNLYPWFGAARKELCTRIAIVGGKSFGDNDFATNALYVGSRRIISDIVRAAGKVDYSDKNLENLLEALTTSKTIQEEASPREEETPKRKARVAGGDFFSQDDYDSVRDKDDSIFSSFASSAGKEDSKEKQEADMLDVFCTETLARIYIEQGHFEQAKYIYSKLILRYPEKNAYFAALIEKLDELKRN